MIGAQTAVILIDQIREPNGRKGATSGTRWSRRRYSRFRPIMLTAVSTVAGPDPDRAPTVFWGPMAFAIMGGLFVANPCLRFLCCLFFYITLLPREAARGSGGPPA